MKKMNKSRARRCNHPWTDEEIEHLINWKLVDFLPAEYAEDETLPPDEQNRILKSVTPFFSDEQLAALDCEVKFLKRQIIEEPERDNAIWESAIHVIPLSESIDGAHRAHTYLRASLGLRTNLSGIGVEAAKLADPHWVRRQSLLKTEQRGCFLDWTGVRSDLWSSLTWRECLSMRYEKNDPLAIELLPTSSRRTLDCEAERLRREIGAGQVTERQLDQAAFTVNPTEIIGQAHQIIRMEYVRARLSGRIARDHPLYQPISRSGLFECIAAIAAGPEASSEQTRQSYVGQFVRYLRIPPGHGDDLVGRILFEVLRLESGLWDHPALEPPHFEGMRWPARLKPEAIQMSKDYRRIADHFAAALEIERNVFSEIWEVYAKLTLKSFWTKRASVKMTVFWAARLLEGSRPEIFQTYGRLIDFFHVQGIRSLIKEEKSGTIDGPMRRAVLTPFLHAVLNDPLLNCVFHAEVFDGRNRLFPRTEKLRADNLVRSHMIAYTVHRLHKERPEPPTVAVTDVLPEGMGLSAHLRHAIMPSKRDPVERIQGYSHFSYAAVLVAALVTDPYWPLTADNAKEIYHRHKDDAEVLHLLKGPDQKNIFTIRCES